MHARVPSPPGLLILAGRQAGVLARHQLLERGLGDSQLRRSVRDGMLVRLEPGLYRLAGHPDDAASRAWGAVLLGGAGARLMGASALAQLDLLPPPRRELVLVPAARVAVDRPWVTFVRGRPGVRVEVTVGRPPRTLTEDAILDHGNRTDDLAAVIGLVTVACLRATTPARLARAVARRPRVRHRRLLNDLLAEVADGVRSPLERRWVHRVERPHGLPAPIRNRTLASGLIADAAWEDYRVLLELDGVAYHPDAARDHRRDNRHAGDGWLTVRYGWIDTERGCRTAAEFGAVLSRRGWTGRPTRCPLCVKDPG